MANDQLTPVAIKPIRIMIQDKAHPQYHYAVYCKDMSETAETIESLDISKVNLVIHECQKGHECVDAWKGNTSPGQVYKMTFEQAVNGKISKRFFMFGSMFGMSTYDPSRPQWFEASLYGGVSGERGIEIYLVDPNGETITTSSIFRAHFQQKTMQERGMDDEAIIDAYIDLFAAPYAYGYEGDTTTDHECHCGKCEHGDHHCNS